MSDLKPLNEDMDAARWAREFNEAITAKGMQPIDPGWLIAWFANAIMCGHDTAQRTAPAGEREGVIEIDRYYFGGADRGTLILQDTKNGEIYTLGELNAAIRALSHPAPDPMSIEGMIASERKREELDMLTRHPAPDNGVMVRVDRLPRLIALVAAACRNAAVENNERDYKALSAIRSELNEAMLSAAQSAKQRGALGGDGGGG